MPTAQELEREADLFRLASQMVKDVTITLRAHGFRSTADVLLALGAMQAQVVSFSVSKGTDMEAALELQNKIVRNIAQALVAGDKPRFDA